MSDEIPIAANDSEGGSGPTGPVRSDELKALRQAIVSVLAEADRLKLPLISIRLDHAHELCVTEIEKLGGEP